jgi:uncharacterized membrane protein YdjX (TVP38/TMEM64 family)
VTQPEFIHRLMRYVVHGDVRGSIAFIQSYGPYAILVAFVLVVLVNIVAVLPNIFLLAANGILFGVTWGTVISWLGESLGVIISFLLMRYLFHDWAHAIIERSEGLKKIDEFSGRRGFVIMLFARCIPYIPSGLITALGAVSSIRIRDYAVATLIGKLPSAAIEVTMGHDLLLYRQHSPRLFILAALSVAAYFVFLHYKKVFEHKDPE